MRLAAYAGASTALAAGVTIYAFNQRANFYSACVYLAQSNLCLMILTNLILFVIASFMFGLQRIFYGPLRPIEIEQLYEKSWFAVTETCLAMTIFREEVGAWFLVMFVALLIGKVWGWIGEGRVEVLEQQPPENPRLVHIRLSLSLAMSLAYDLWLLYYTISTVIQQAKPNMMVMFLFEFAVLSTSSTSTYLRYCISLIESRIVKKQTEERLEWRRREIREEREEILRLRVAASTARENTEAVESSPAETPLPSEDDVDEMDVEVPGWEAKGQWILTLDLLTDFVKLGIYTTFFFIILAFYGLPIHIMRDTFLTARSFVKRLTAFLRYRKATQDMNERYPDASVEEIQREDTCIICREEMRPWSVTNPEAPAPAPAAPENVAPQHPVAPVARARTTPLVNERTRPKKLPCGHVLHLGCLKSWLERQQVCPTCRRPVVDNARAHGRGHQDQGAPAQARPADAPANGQVRQGNMRMIHIGPLRFAFGQANNMQDFAQRFAGAHQAGQQNPAPGNGPRVYGLELGFPRLQPPPPGPAAPPPPDAALSIPAQLRRVETQIMADIVQLQLNQNELQIITQMQQNLLRIRAMRQGRPTTQRSGSAPHLPQAAPTLSPMANTGQTTLPHRQHHAAAPGVSAIPAGSPNLPPGVTLPEGWSLMPLQRMDSESLALPGINGVVSHMTANQAGQNVNPSVADYAHSPYQAVLAPPGSDAHRQGATAAALASAAINGTGQVPAVGVPPEEISDGSLRNARGDVLPSSTLSDWSAIPELNSSGISSLDALGSNNQSATSQPSTSTISLPTLPAEIALPSSASTSATQPGNTQVRSFEDEASSADQSKGKGRAATVEDGDAEE